MDLHELCLSFGWIALHVLGLATGWATRLAAGSRLEPVFQFSFFAMLIGLSCVAWLSHQHELGLWIPTGFTIGLMVLMAVIDLSSAGDLDDGIRFSAVDSVY